MVKAKLRALYAASLICQYYLYQNCTINLSKNIEKYTQYLWVLTSHHNKLDLPYLFVKVDFFDPNIQMNVSQLSDPKLHQQLVW